MDRPRNRSILRKKLAEFYFELKKKYEWFYAGKDYASNFSINKEKYVITEHKSCLYRELKDVDRWMQDNKVINLSIAVKKLSGLLIKPGQIFSYWRQIGNPVKSGGYVSGMVLENGLVKAGIGGGLCQLSNLIFWMTLHTPLTVNERWRHDYDVFPDSARQLPFGSGATCSYPNVDLVIKNSTANVYQLVLWLDNQYLYGEWRANSRTDNIYKVIEKNHVIKPEWWGGYSRNNEIVRQIYHDGIMVEEELVAENHAVMMYEPLLKN